MTNAANTRPRIGDTPKGFKVQTKSDFSGKWIGGTLYYRVVIGPAQSAEKAQSVLMKLKDAGFEGVLLFPE